VPRGAERERAILAAALSIVGEVGYVAAVARRAGASKAAIYRRWPNEAALVRAALDAEDAASVSDTGALRTDLLASPRPSPATSCRPTSTADWSTTWPRP
jgi:AcrR family transcriptional regulator